MTALAKKVAELFGKPEAEKKTPLVRPIVKSWPCPHCGCPAEIEAVEPSFDGQRMLTFWHCEPCQTYAVTPDTIREPPVWVQRIEQ